MLLALAVIGGIIGAISFSGSLIAFGKLQGLIKKSWRFVGQQALNVAILLGVMLAFGAWVVLSGNGEPRRRSSCSSCSRWCSASR